MPRTTHSNIDAAILQIELDLITLKRARGVMALRAAASPTPTNTTREVLPITPAPDIGGTQIDKVLELVRRKRPGMRADAAYIAMHFGLPQKYAGQLLARAARRGLLRRTGRGQYALRRAK